MVYQAWIGIYKKGTSVEWKNVKLWQWRKSTGVNIFDTKSLEGGDYEARLFLNNSFQIEKSKSFNISLDFNEFYDWKGRFVEFKANYIRPNTWIGIYEKGASNDWKNVVLWTWATQPNDFHKSIAGFSKEKLAVLDLFKDYEARLFFYNSYKTEATIPFHRTKPTLNTSSSFNTYSLDNGEVYPLHLDVMLTDYDESFIDKDWIAIFKKGDERVAENIIDRAYTTDPRFGGEHRCSRWKFTDMSKYKKGTTYEAVLFSNDTYKVIDSIEITYK
jgi:hypothetical protein